ncbi:fumarylacetoacetate hydrolase family protein [Rhodopseudomonas sp. P2A-2r]|uniref:fumarylacetoacetate hydrolase family protein n=1 Tax=unclassified Rhodopseudomonas TaxID=2638247 RepID=UPI002234A4BB|nr:fumarylacetoacetate hydrolase family protein [Rhodopseudomonas sp. P2A-2r]UZE50177.1 fumarylacetoacetate hydrolase family protein [Rhodopseudomonas sp. P2A-2r]
MIFLTFAAADGSHLGLLTGDDVLDLTAAWPKSGAVVAPHHVGELAEAGEPGLAIVRDLAAGKPTGLLARGSLKLLAPIPRPKKNVFCVGRNYKEHIDEGMRAQGKAPAPLPVVPEIFTKPPTAVIADGDSIPQHANVTEQLDYEVELAVIVGRGGSNIAAKDAFDHVFGYSIINDITGRDMQRRYGQWFKGKGLDRSCPFGPVVVHVSALPNVGDLRISSTVNGELRQDSRTSRMIFPIPEIFEHLSRGMTLEPGDVIATGTPSGVGYAMTPPRFLVKGDKVTAEIEGIGILHNDIVA